MRKCKHNILFPKSFWYGVKVYILAYIGHILNRHTMDNMYLYADEEGNGWCCPFCDWDHLDIYSYRQNEK